MVTNIATAEAGPGAPAVMRWVVFRCGDRDFGVPLAQVNEIVAPLPFTRLPGSGADVCGLVGVRGRVITVFDLGIVLADRAAAQVSDHRLLLIEMDDTQVGAAVDEVREIASASLETPAAGETVMGAASPAVLGTARGDDGPFTVLDPQRLLRHRLQTQG